MGKVIATRKTQGGFSIMELVIVVAVALVLLAISINFVMGASRTARKTQETDQVAREIGMISQAVRAHLAEADAATYPLNTTVAISISDLVTAGLLPTEFAARAGTGSAAITPFGQPYIVVARRIVADEVPTAVIAESGTPIAEKLGKVGVENLDAPILALKQGMAAQGNAQYKTIGATIPKGSRTATGVGRSFTKDLTDYFTAGFTQASAVALVNFKDLEPGGGNDGGGIPPAPTYGDCRVVQGQVNGAGTTFFTNVCREDQGFEIVGDRNANVCGNHGDIVVLPFGGTLTTGEAYRYSAVPVGRCPPANQTQNADGSYAGCNPTDYRKDGILTMNSVALDSKQCEIGRWPVGGGAFNVQIFPVAEYNVCCRVD